MAHCMEVQCFKVIPEFKFPVCPLFALGTVEKSGPHSFLPVSVRGQGHGGAQMDTLGIPKINTPPSGPLQVSLCPPSSCSTMNNSELFQNNSYNDVTFNVKAPVWLKSIMDVLYCELWKALSSQAGMIGPYQWGRRPSVA